MAAAFFSFLILVVGLLIIVAMIFLALDRVARDDFLKRIGKYAVGGAAVLVLLIALKSLFFGGASGGGIAPASLIEFAIGVIILLVAFFLVDRLIAFFAPPYLDIINYVLTAVMLIIVLFLAEKALFGGGLGLISGQTFQLLR